MAKTTRNQRATGGVLVSPPPPLRVPGRAPKEYRQGTCPLCGRPQALGFWERTPDFDPSHPLGVIQDVSGGRGAGFQVIGALMPEDDPGLFALMKARFLAAVRQWREQGWLTLGEITGAEPPPVPPPPVAPVRPPRPPAPPPLPPARPRRKRPAPSKEPWERTRAEFIRWHVAEKRAEARALGIEPAAEQARWSGELHRRMVQEALAEGKPVPADVLKDYPDLEALGAAITGPPPPPPPAPVAPPKPPPPPPVEIPQDQAELERRRFVQEAIAAGKKVPEEVRKEFPDLFPPPPPPPPEPPPSVGIPAFELAEKPGRAAAQKLILHLRLLAKMDPDAPEVEKETERLAEAFNAWVEPAEEALGKEEEKENPNEDRLALLEEKRDALLEIQQALEDQEDLAETIAKLEDAFPPPPPRRKPPPRGAT